MSKWVSVIVAANIAVFMLQLYDPGVTEIIELVPTQVAIHPWTPFTYMFAHGGIWHIALNMWSLVLFGPRVETFLGARRFVSLYLLSGLGGALLSCVLQFEPIRIVGASGAVFGVMAGYGRLWPKDKILLYGIVPVTVLWFLVGMVAYSILGGQGFVGEGIAHYGHLGGIAVGWVYMGWLASRSGAKKFAQRAIPVAPILSDTDAMTRWAAIQVAQLHPINRDEVLRLLQKARAGGARSLSIEERATLDRFSRA